MNVDLAPVQFAFTSINHFFFVSVTIGLAFLTALLQTAWYRSKQEEYLRLTRFFGAPLAMEGLGAFFLESTFLGLWLFGWDKLPKKVHLLTIWAVAFGSAFSALFILAANSWMQHPVGYVMVHGKPQLNDIWALFTNQVFVWGHAKVLLASLTTGAVVMLAVSAWHLRHRGDREVFTNPRDPAPAIAAGHQPLERQGDRAYPDSEPVRRQVRARQLRAKRVHPVLVDAGDGLPGASGPAHRAVGLWLAWRRTLAISRVFLWVAVWGAVLPFLMNTSGWLLTESGRQPRIVQGIMLTKNGIAPTVSTTWLWISPIGFILLYGILGTVDLLPMLRYSRQQLPPARDPADADQPVPAIQY